MAKILVTGAAGFLGYHLVHQFVTAKGNHQVVGLDVINNYYDVRLKHARLEMQGISRDHLVPYFPITSKIFPSYRFIQADLADQDFILAFMMQQRFDYVVNFGIQADVCYSIENPMAFAQSAIAGFSSLLEGCRHSKVKHLVYASMASEYEGNATQPLSEQQGTGNSLWFYTATKKSSESIARLYTHLFDIPTTDLRFSNVYGPWDRPDMPVFHFTDALYKGKPIRFLDYVEMTHDFTYVADIVESVMRITLKPEKSKSGRGKSQANGDVSSAPYRSLAIGNSGIVQLNAYIDAIEEALGKTGKTRRQQSQPEDVSVAPLDKKTHLEPRVSCRSLTTVKEGVKQYVDWYRWYYNREVILW